ncbi:hypothetical protein MNBD_NITROSPINAE01-915 [hydrothermal vent metagenome]|uniref:Uncharacterized protein n=1 Tax=hydrothermal vent metagenome TaxID=652676 RepID=A0A3B1D4U7_9ZZZZ
METGKNLKQLLDPEKNRKILLLFKKTFLIALLFIIVGFSLDLLMNGFTAGEALQRVLDNIWQPLAFAFAVAILYKPRKNKA